MKILSFCALLVIAVPVFAQERARPAGLEVIDSVAVNTQAEAPGAPAASKRAEPKEAAKIEGIRLTPSSGAAYFVRDEKREGITRRLDGPELKGQAPTWKVLAW